jgi:hypothetical protein
MSVDAPVAAQQKRRVRVVVSLSWKHVHDLEPRSEYAERGFFFA